MRKKFYWGTLLAILYVFFEGGALFSLFLQKKIFGIEYSPIRLFLSDAHKEIVTFFIEKKSNYLTYSPTLGWTIKKYGATRSLYRANSQGIRANKDYPLTVLQNTIRISSFGDSYTHCDGVKNEDTWQEKLGGINRTLEVMNFGVTGFGLDQAFLRYQQDGVSYQPDVVFIGFMTENIFRNVNVFRPFYQPQGGLPFTKPRFSIQDDRLVLLKNSMRELSQYTELLTHPEIVLPKLGAHDYFYHIHYKQGFFDFLPSVRLIKMESFKIIRKYIFDDIIDDSSDYASIHGYYNENSEAFLVTAGIFDEFYRNAVSHNSIPIILVFPNTWDIIRYRANGTKAYTPLLTYFDMKNYQYIDLLNAFDIYGKEFEVKDLCAGHYSVLGNEIVARYIGEYLEKNGLGNSTIFKKNESSSHLKFTK